MADGAEPQSHVPNVRLRLQDPEKSWDIDFAANRGCPNNKDWGSWYNHSIGEK